MNLNNIEYRNFVYRGNALNLSTSIVEELRMVPSLWVYLWKRQKTVTGETRILNIILCALGPPQCPRCASEKYIQGQLLDLLD